MTTPSDYSPKSSGFLGFTRGISGSVDGALVTRLAVERYNDLVFKYRIQFKESRNVELHPEDGVTVAKDRNGNSVFRIDAQHLEYFLFLNHWQKSGKAADSIWMKLKDKVGQ